MNAPTTVVRRSKNAKLTSDPKNRPVSATYASQRSCPTTCPFLSNGCYFEAGHAGITARRLAKAGGTAESIAASEAAQIDALPASGQPLRIHVGGDCTTDTAARTVSEAADNFTARGGGPAWTYTHAWRSVHRLSWGTVSVLASCETARDCAVARHQGYAAELTTDDVNEAKRALAEVGLRGFECPEQMGKARDCESCRLCTRDDALRRAGSVLLLTPHGGGSAKVVKALR